MYNIVELDSEIYVNSEMDRDQMRSLIAKTCGGKIYLSSVRNEYIDIELTKNELHDPKQMGGDAGFMHYPHRGDAGPYLEVHASFGSRVEMTEEYRDIFLDMFMRVIIALRESGAQVAVACDYEDLIAERTGTSWNRTIPHHPPVGDGA